MELYRFMETLFTEAHVHFDLFQQFSRILDIELTCVDFNFEQH